MKKAIVVRALALDFLQEIDSFVKSKKTVAGLKSIIIRISSILFGQ